MSAHHLGAPAFNDMVKILDQMNDLERKKNLVIEWCGIQRAGIFVISPCTQGWIIVKVTEGAFPVLYIGELRYYEGLHGLERVLWKMMGCLFTPKTINYPPMHTHFEKFNELFSQ